MCESAARSSPQPAAACRPPNVEVPADAGASGTQPILSPRTDASRQRATEALMPAGASASSGSACAAASTDGAAFFGRTSSCHAMPCATRRAARPCAHAEYRPSASAAIGAGGAPAAVALDRCVEDTGAPGGGASIVRIFSWRCSGKLPTRSAMTLEDGCGVEGRVRCTRSFTLESVPSRAAMISAFGTSSGRFYRCAHPAGASKCTVLYRCVSRLPPVSFYLCPGSPRCLFTYLFTYVSRLPPVSFYLFTYVSRLPPVSFYL